MATWEYELPRQGLRHGIIVFKDNAKVYEYPAKEGLFGAGVDASLISTAKINLGNSGEAGYEGMTLRPVPKAEESSAATTNKEVANEQNSIPVISNDPTDLRLAFHSSNGQVVYSMSSANEHLLVDGMQFAEGKDLTAQQQGKKKMQNEFTVEELKTRASEFIGVPALINPNSYINLQAAGGKINNKYLIDRENSIRFYNISEPGVGDGSGVQSSSAPTVNEIVNWSRSNAGNIAKFPYKFTDFAFLKWWQKIPNNYLITLRRYPFPVNDAVTSSVEITEKINDKLHPVATMLTFLGEDPGNKISTILGPIETGLKWKDFTADVWAVTTSGSAASVNNPAPGLGKLFALLATGDGRSKEPGPVPPDPYNNGPYANKIIGPINVITSTKGRDKGLVFSHKIELVFEYSLRGIGGINTKAAGLDIIGNIMLMTSATAPFWGGSNRHMPHAGGGTADPFLGGKAGKAAWLRGDPAEFFGALKAQFLKIGDNLSEIFSQIAENPIEGLQKLASDGAAAFMKNSTTQGSLVTEGVHSLLTGAPVGEWHVCIGPPMNPMMMMGNMICTSSKLEFSEELGPDDFPAEIKVTISLEHGMPRDKAGIESMFNKGRGRIYALPKGYEQTLASSSQSPIDTSIKSRYKLMRNELAGSSKEADGKTAEQKQTEKTDPGSTNKQPAVGSVQAALYSQGYSYLATPPEDTPKK